MINTKLKFSLLTFTAKYKKEMQSPKWINHFQELSNGNIFLDQSKKKTNEQQPTAMFRKLNID